MDSRSLVLLAFWGLSVLAQAGGNCLPAPAYPATRVDALSDTFFGVCVKDPYRWLEDARQPEVKEWVGAQNQACAATLAKMGLGAELESKLKPLLDQERYSLPQKRGYWLYYSRQDPGQEQALLLRRQEEGGKEQVLLDPNAWPKDRHAILGDWYVSQDGAKLAYTQRWNNSDQGALRVLDVASGREAEEDCLSWADWADFAWSPDSLGFYYTRLPKKGSAPDTELPGRADIAFHHLGEAAQKDLSVYPPARMPRSTKAPRSRMTAIGCSSCARAVSAARRSWPRTLWSPAASQSACTAAPRPRPRSWRIRTPFSS